MEHIHYSREIAALFVSGEGVFAAELKTQAHRATQLT